MSFHKWRRLPTKHFGEVWVPLAHIQLQANDGKLHALALQIDSGAVVSLLSRSVADLLKLDLESGDRVELSSVGAPRLGVRAAAVFRRMDRNCVSLVPVPAERASCRWTRGRRIW